MRILYISHTHPPKDAPLENIGGMQRVSVQLYRALQTREDVTVIPIILHSSWNRIVVNTILFMFNLLYSLPKKAVKENVDIILFSSMVTASLSVFLRSRIKIPMAVICHGLDVTTPNIFYQKFVRKVFSKLDGVIAVSNATKLACTKRGIPTEKAFVVSNGLDKKDIGVVPDKTEAKKFLSDSLGIDLSDKDLLLTVGRLVKRKGHEWFVRSIWPGIQRDCVYLIIGDGPELADLQSAIKNAPQKENIILLGKQPDSVLKNAYSAADVFVMPNIRVSGDMEGFGIVLIEANYCSTPVVASELEGIKDVIEPGKNGYLVQEGDAELFAKKIDFVLNEELEKLSATCKKYVEDRFGWEYIIGRYISVLREIKEQKIDID